MSPRSPRAQMIPLSAMPEGATETFPLITNVHADKQSGRANDTAEISDEEAYAKLKAKRAERRRKKLIRRGIAGVIGGVVLIAIVATLVINAQPQGASGPVTDMVTEGTFTTTVEAKGQLKPISSSVVSPSVDGTVDYQRAGRPIRQRGRRAHDH